MRPENKRKHHVVPATYLRGFADNNGKLYEYLKNDPKNPRYNSPRRLGYRKDYYAQRLSDGVVDYNSLEDQFSLIESEWPRLVKVMTDRQALNNTDIFKLYNFLSMVYARIPSTRDAIEAMLAFEVKQVGEIIEAAGELPPRPPELRGVELQVAIDPYKSLEAMGSVAAGFTQFLCSITFRILVNRTSISFITSDHPFVRFHGGEEGLSSSSKQCDGWEVIIPLTSTLALHGYSGVCGFESFTYDKVNRESTVLRINRLICMFGYDKIYANSRVNDKLVLKHAGASPILKSEVHRNKDMRLHLHNMALGVRSKLPKW